MDISEISALVTGLTGAAQALGAVAAKRSDAAKELTDIRTTLLDVSTKAVELNAWILSLQQRNAELEQEIREFKSFDGEMERHSLHEVRPGVVVYKRTEPNDSGQPVVYACTNCFGQRQVSILQRHETSFSAALFCHQCKAEYPLPRGR